MTVALRDPPEIGNAENFTLEDFFSMGGMAFRERTAIFSKYYADLRASGQALYAREIVGGLGRTVQVRDKATGAVRPMVMLSSNNYLGLTTHPHVIEAVQRAVGAYGAGVAGPPLLAGMTSLHRQLEQRLAALKGAEDAMLFGSGYQANVALMDGLLRDRDVLVYDQLSHASLFDGLRMARGQHDIHAARFRHNDPAHLERVLADVNARRRAKSAQVFVAVEGVYSMDGDIAPLAEITGLCRRFDACLIVDDAHGTGVLGPRGEGTSAHFGLSREVDVNMGTFSKALGMTGGFVAATGATIDYLRFFARPYLFSAHLPIATVAAVLAGLDVMEREPERLVRLHQNARYLGESLRAQGLSVPSETAILPVRVPAHVDILALDRRLHQEGLFLNSIAYPVVPHDAQRIRISVSSEHTRADLDYVASVFAKLNGEFAMTSGPSS